MDFNIISHIIILIMMDFPLDSIRPGEGLTGLLESNETATWEEARSKCQQNGKLANIADVVVHSDLSPGTFWIFVFRALSPWVWMQGCFNKTSLDNANKNEPDDIKHSAGTCALKCEMFPYFALGAYASCYCLGEKEVQVNFNQSMKISPKNCTICGKDICGIHDGIRNSVFLYQKYNENMLSIENVEKERDQNLRCVTTGYNESNPGVLTFLFTNCYEKHQGVCIIDKNGRLGLTSTLRTTWLETIKECNKLFGYPVDALNLDHIRSATQANRFWISVYRDNVNHFDETILSANKIKTSCSFFNVTKFNEGLNYNFYYSDCNVDRRYICRISDMMTSPSANVSDKNPFNTELSTGLNISAIIGGCAGAIVLMIVVLLVVFRMKRSKKSKKKNTEIHFEGNLDNAHAGFSTGTKDTQSEENVDDQSETVTTTVLNNKNENTNNEIENVNIDTQQNEYDIFGKKTRKGNQRKYRPAVRQN